MFLFLPPMPLEPTPTYVVTHLPAYHRATPLTPTQQIPPTQRPEAILPLSPAARLRRHRRAEGLPGSDTGTRPWATSPATATRLSWPWTTPFPSDRARLDAASA